MPESDRIQQAYDDSSSDKEITEQLFDPLSPDKDTVSTRMLTNQERLDNEFWLLQRLSQIMEKANFYELTEAEIKNKMSEHEHHEGVKVSVDVDNYSILKFWVLGKEAVKLDQSLYSRLVRLFRRQSANQSESMYKRVISAARLKKEDKLTLKAFKDISVDDLEKVLPLGSIKIGKFDRYMIITAIGLTGLAFLSKLVTVLAKISVSWPLVMAGFTSLLGVKGYWAYRSRCNNYMAALNKTLYYKNIANNRGLLTLVIDRAQDETFKETLLTYTFVQALSRGDNHGYLPSEVTSISLENAIEQWVHDRTGAAIEFDSAEAISILEKVGILSLTNTGVSQTLSVLPLEQAHRLLPQTPLSVLTRVDDADVTEGYDRFRYEASNDSKTNNSFMKIFSSSK
ncbi:transmembrane protein 143-like [Watersipora subatra]|uniref:transmembrane protein 143-like n=1 Tax=Watersipora subatra TaxID=2589382 RepID=UPI00355B6B11